MNPSSPPPYYFQLKVLNSDENGHKMAMQQVIAILLIIIDIGWIIWGITFISQPRTSIPPTMNLKSVKLSSLRTVPQR